MYIKFREIIHYEKKHDRSAGKASGNTQKKFKDTHSGCIINTPQILTYKNRTYYMCCPTCKAAMEKRLVLESRER